MGENLFSMYNLLEFVMDKSQRDLKDILLKGNSSYIYRECYHGYRLLSSTTVLEYGSNTTRFIQNTMDGQYRWSSPSYVGCKERFSIPEVTV